MSTIVRRPANLVFRKAALPFVPISASALAGCATYRPPEISYDDSVPPLPTVDDDQLDRRPATGEQIGALLQLGVAAGRYQVGAARVEKRHIEVPQVR